jgi:hypothetical protein
MDIGSTTHLVPYPCLTRSFAQGHIIADAAQFSTVCGILSLYQHDRAVLDTLLEQTGTFIRDGLAFRSTIHVKNAGQDPRAVENKRLFADRRVRLRFLSIPVRAGQCRPDHATNVDG